MKQENTQLNRKDEDGSSSGFIDRWKKANKNRTVEERLNWLEEYVPILLSQVDELKENLWRNLCDHTTIRNEIRRQQNDKRL